MQADIERKVRQFIDDNFLFRDEHAALADGESLIDAGLIDSTGILELVGFLENDFHIRVADAEIVPENLDSIRSIVTYVAAKLETTTEAA
jgi:acyl carrier protein